MNIDEILCDYNIFVTGASGFIGTVLLQRLLNIKNSKDCKIFCLLRCGRKHSTVTERLRNEILKNEILELGESEIEDIIVNKRIIPLEGELTEDLLGFDDKTISRLKYSHNSNNKKGIVIIHCAADIDFQREINQSININVNGTYQCINVGNEIDAKCFIHISTLYVNSREHRDKHVKEEIYDSGLNFVEIFQKWLKLKKEQQKICVFDEKYIREIKSKTSKNDPLQRQEWPNNYTFTKNMTENVVKYYCDKETGFDIPTSIIRLGIVSPIHKGKHLGWFMGNGGFVFLVIGIATGNISYLNGDGRGRPDFVPVDYTCDTILAVTANTINFNNDENRDEIYQCGVIANAPNWSVEKSLKYARPRFLAKELPYCKENAGMSFIQSKTLFFFIELILYEIPLFLLGILSIFISMLSSWYWIKIFYNLFGYKYDVNFLNNNHKKSSCDLTISEQIRSLKLIIYDKPFTFVKRANFMKKARGKLNWFNANYTYFVNQRWCFDHSNVKKLYNSLDKESSIKYDFDVNKINFDKYAFDAALVCFNKYINYRNEKKKTKIEIENELKNKLDFLIKEEKNMILNGEQDTEENILINEKKSLTKDEKLQILHVLRKLFLMVGLDAKVSFCIFFGMATVAVFSFSIL